MSDNVTDVKIRVSTQGQTAVDRLLNAFGRLGKTKVSDPTRDIQRGLTDTARDADKASGALGRLVSNASRKAADPTSEMRKGMRDSARAADDLKSAVGRVIAIGTAAAGFKKVAGEAISFESAMADVRKVVDASDADFKALQDNIVGMSRVIPVSTQGLAQIAAAAGQMGIAVKDIPTFTELVAKSSTAFGMLPEQAGQAFASLRSIFRLTQDDLSLMADTINVLGNTTASNERSIIDVLTRIGSTGQAVGLTADTLAALAANALPAFGGSAERAATGINSLLTTLATTQAASPKVQDAMAQMGYAAGQFGALMQKDAVGAVKDFYAKLSEFDNQSRAGIVSTIFGQGSVDEVLTLKNAFDDAGKSLADISDKSKVAGAVQKEFATRAATTENAIQLLKNGMGEAATEVGNAFLPQIKELVTKAKELAQRIAAWAKEHPDLVKQIGLAAGALLSLKAATMAISTLFGGMPGVIMSMVGVIGKVGPAASLAGGALTAMGGAAATLMRGLAGFVLTPTGGILAAFTALFILAVKVRRAIDDARFAADKAQLAMGNRARADGFAAVNAGDYNYQDMTSANVALAAAQDAVDKAYAKADKARNVDQADIAVAEVQVAEARLAKVKEAYDRAREAYEATLDQPAPLPPELQDAAPASTTGQTGTKKFTPLGTGGTGGGTSRTIKALNAVTTAEIEAEKRRIDSANTVLQAELEATLDKRLISQRDYIEQKKALDLKALADERATLVKTKQEIERALSVKGISDQERESLRTQLIRLNADIDSTLDKEKTISIKAEVDMQSLERDLAQMRASLQSEIAGLQGNTLAAATAQITSNRDAAIGQTSDPGVRALIEQKASLELQRAAYEERKRIADETLSYLSLREQELTAQYEDGQMSMLEHEQALNAERAKAAEAIKKQADAMRELAAANPEMKLQVAQMDAEVARLSKTSDILGDTWKHGVADAITGAAGKIGTDIKSLGDLGRSILQSLADTLKQFALNELNSQIVKAMGSAAGGGSGAGGLVSALISAYFGGARATGGDVYGDKAYLVGEKGPELFVPGVSGSIATNAALNKAVSGATPSAGAGGAAGAQVGVRIINQIQNQDIADAMDSPAGEVTFKNLVGRNANYLRQVVQGG